MSRRMKDSGVEWIGEIPEDWEIGKVKHSFFATKTIAGNNHVNYNRLALTLNGVIPRAKTDAHGLQPTNFESYQVAEDNDLVFKLIDLENVKTSRVGRSPYVGLVSPAYIVLRSLTGQPTFYEEYYFLAMWMNEIFNNLGEDGVRSSLNSTQLINIPLLMLDKTVKEKIVHYLDEKTATIDHIIEKTKESIEDYKLYKQSLISEAVTKGLNPDVKLKDSGVEWIGEIPEHWDVARLGKIASIKTGNTPSMQGDCDYYKDGTLLWVKPDNLEEFLPISQTKERINELGVEKARVAKARTPLVCCIGSIGKLGYAEQAVAYNQQINAVEFDDKYIYWKYGLYFLSTQEEQHLFYSAGNVVRILNTQNQRMISVSIPPIEEQKMISSFLGNKLTRLEEIITQKEQLIEDLEAYKKSLIYEVVTGKREVQ